MVLGIPVVDGHDLTITLLMSLEETITNPSTFTAVIIDNGSTIPYRAAEFTDYPFRIDVIRYENNQGYYVPLKHLSDKYDDPLIGLIHNDMVLYERGWNERMQAEFERDNKLALVGLCGSNEIDERGGRGGGTVCYFRGADVQIGDRVIRGQDQAAGGRIVGLFPAACLDSLFMMFRREAIRDLTTEADPWEDITLAHFYDRIWPVRLIENGWHVGTMGVECDHLGGMTTTGNERYRDDCIKWLEDRGFAYENPETEMYLIAERRYLDEYRDQKHFLPCKIENDYSHVRLT